MEYNVTKVWDEALWLKAEVVYQEAFPGHKGKKRSIIRGMFERKLSALHTWTEAGEIAAMALTSTDRHAQAVIIDHLAVSASRRERGIGLRCVEAIREWAETTEACRSIIIEAEADPTEENADRIRFWLKAGFLQTEYVHHYIWVPETYVAMYVPIAPAFQPSDNGKSLFKVITKYHEKAYRGQD
ncbi:GNAT family N-acetyltransferase [Paenibacillus silvisoli]|uniref:GNAT family N-acetyltransferase n=1 Tax=Paenibacillus silvisoli TaxID=3110539 RepID=UPI00280611AB|nr:GNAT family N-acetyltransferase [Paenibacillus silvisoli]